LGRTVAEGRRSRPDGQVENQAGVLRERLFKPRLRFRSYGEMNAGLLDRCVVHARAQAHPDDRTQTVWQMLEAERPRLVRHAEPFDGFHALPAAVSKTCLVRFDNNKYSLAAAAIGRPVEIHGYADRIVIRAAASRPAGRLCPLRPADPALRHH